MRGRKKLENANIKSLTIKITQDQFDMLKKNPVIKKDLIKYVREYLDMFRQK